MWSFVPNNSIVFFICFWLMAFCGRGCGPITPICNTNLKLLHARTGSHPDLNSFVNLIIYIYITPYLSGLVLCETGCWLLGEQNYYTSCSMLREHKNRNRLSVEGKSTEKKSKTFWQLISTLRFFIFLHFPFFSLPLILRLHPRTELLSINLQIYTLLYCFWELPKLKYKMSFQSVNMLWYVNIFSTGTNNLIWLIFNINCFQWTASFFAESIYELIANKAWQQWMLK